MQPARQLSLGKQSSTYPKHHRGITNPAEILRTTFLKETTRPGERVHQQGDELAVILLDRGEIGQFGAVMAGPVVRR